MKSTELHKSWSKALTKQLKKLAALTPRCWLRYSSGKERCMQPGNRIATGSRSGVADADTPRTGPALKGVQYTKNLKISFFGNSTVCTCRVYMSQVKRITTKANVCVKTRLHGLSQTVRLATKAVSGFSFQLLSKEEQSVQRVSSRLAVAASLGRGTGTIFIFSVFTKSFPSRKCSYALSFSLNRLQKARLRQQRKCFWA